MIELVTCFLKLDSNMVSGRLSAFQLSGEVNEHNMCVIPTTQMMDMISP